MAKRFIGPEDAETEMVVWHGMCKCMARRIRMELSCVPEVELVTGSTACTTYSTPWSTEPPYSNISILS